MRDDRARLAQNYSSAADGYAEFWSPLIRPPARRMLDALPWERTNRILDVGTGTGALLGDLVLLAPAARIVGIDISPGMLSLAPRKHAWFAMMDAAALGLRDGAFDVAVIAFALFHMPSPIAALQEVRRVLRPGGALGVTTWAEEIPAPVTTIWDEELAAAGAWDPSPQPPRQHEVMDTEDKVSGLLAGGGFLPARTWRECIEHRWDLARFTGLRTRFGDTRRKLEVLDPDVRRAALDRIARRMSAADDDDFRYRGVIVCAVARAAP